MIVKTNGSLNILLTAKITLTPYVRKCADKIDYLFTHQTMDGYTPSSNR